GRVALEPTDLVLVDAAVPDQVNGLVHGSTFPGERHVVERESAIWRLSREEEWSDGMIRSNHGRLRSPQRFGWRRATPRSPISPPSHIVRLQVCRVPRCALLLISLD